MVILQEITLECIGPKIAYINEATLNFYEIWNAQNLFLKAKYQH